MLTNNEKRFEINELLKKYKEFKYNGYVVTNLGPELNSKGISYYGTLSRYRAYNYYSSDAEYEIFEDKELLIDCLLEKNKYEGYYNRLSELNTKNIDFDFSYDLVKYINDWNDNYFKRENDIQVKYKNGNLSKIINNAYLYIDEYGNIEISNGKKTLNIDIFNNDIESLMIRFKQRIKGSIKATFATNFVGGYKSIYNKLEYKCNYQWWNDKLYKEIEQARKDNLISDEEYNILIDYRAK